MELWQHCCKSDYPLESSQEDISLEVVAGELAKYVIPDSDDLNFICKSKLHKVDAELDMFISSNDQRPDVVAYTSPGDDVVLVLEVLSVDSMEIELNTLIMALITQLRLLRKKFDVDTCFGFVLPAKKSATAVKVKVMWKELHFHYSFFFWKWEK